MKRCHRFGLCKLYICYELTLKFKLYRCISYTFQLSSIYYKTLCNKQNTILKIIAVHKGKQMTLPLTTSLYVHGKKAQNVLGCNFEDIFFIKLLIELFNYQD